jgi:hypothetical protein
MTYRSLCRYSTTLRHAEVVIEKEEEEYQTEEDEGRADEREREFQRSLNIWRRMRKWFWWTMS